MCRADLWIRGGVIDAQVLAPGHPLLVIGRGWGARQIRSERKSQQLLDILELHIRMHGAQRSS